MATCSRKEEVAAAVADAVAGEIGPQLRQILTTSEPSGARFVKYVRAFLAYCAQPPASVAALIDVVDSCVAVIGASRAIGRPPHLRISSSCSKRVSDGARCDPSGRGLWPSRCVRCWTTQLR